MYPCCLQARSVARAVERRRVRGECGAASDATIFQSEGWRLADIARLRQAAHLLRDPGLSISSVAFEVGFQDISVFNHAFRQIFCADAAAAAGMHGTAGTGDVHPIAPDRMSTSDSSMNMAGSSQG
jgi:hypothetical protein